VSLRSSLIPPTIRVLTLIESATVTGPARNLLEFAKAGRSADADLPAVEVTILTYRRGQEESALALAARDAGVPVITVDERRRWDTQVLPQLERAISDHNPDILETRNVKSHFFVRRLGLHRKYLWVAWNHGYTATSWLDRAYTQMDRWSLRGVYRMVTVCRPFAEKLVSLGVPREKITILHNAVKPFVFPAAEQVEQLRRSLALGDDEAVILSVGRLSYEKGHADLLRAGATLAATREAPPFRIVIVGEGPERDTLQRLASQLGIERLVTLAGFQRDTKPYYAVATAVAVPSHSEGSPNVVLEAMAAGLPIVANAVGGVPEILEEGVTGLMVPARNPEGMAHALRRVLSDAELRNRLGTAAQAQALSDYTPEAYRRKLVGFYRDVLRSRQPRTDN
jgi:glycosyltransferase involved in cell wall biosynthesis